MQLNASLLALVACAALPIQPAMADLTCRPGYTHASVEGIATTVNVSAAKQIGQVCLKMQAGDKVVFDDCGTLIGTVTATDPATGQPSKLSHTAVFEILESFKTVNDAVLDAVSDPANPACAFNVREQLTTLKWGTGIFLGGALNVTAEGRVSFCPGDNKNTFELSGEACLRK